MKQLTAGMLFLLAVCYSTAAVANGHTLSVTPETYTKTSSSDSVIIQVTWNVPDGANYYDWIALYRSGSSDYDYLDYVKTYSTETSGSVLFEVSETGTYELRYFTQWTYWKQATSPAVVVSPAEGDGEYSITLPKDPYEPYFTAAANTDIQFDWTAVSTDNLDYDWIGLYFADDPNSSYLSYMWTYGMIGASTWFPPATTPGIYNIRYLKNNGYGDVLRSEQFSVGQVAFRYPVDTLVTDDNGWSSNQHGYGSLNLLMSIHPLWPYAPHTGADWNQGTCGDCDYGLPVYAIADGTIVAKNYYCPKTNGVFSASCATLYPGWDPQETTGWGRTILIRHDAPTGKKFLTGKGQLVSSVYSMYAHIAEPNDTKPAGATAEYNEIYQLTANVDGTVTKGQIIAQLGDGGNKYTNNSHLHFEIRTDATAGTYRLDKGYVELLSTFTHPSEFINNNMLMNYVSDGSDIPVGTSVTVHVHDDGMYLDDVQPVRERSSAHDDICSDAYKNGEWKREGCNYGTYDLGYTGQIFWKPTDVTGTAKWVPNLPKSGQWEVEVYVPQDHNTTKHACYHVYNAGSEVDTYDCTSTPTGSDDRVVNQDTMLPTVPAKDRWQPIGTFTLTPSSTTYVELNNNTDEDPAAEIAVDAVRFVYKGE